MPFMNLPEVIETVRLGKTTIYDMIKRGEFPKQIKISRKKALWDKEKIDAWMKEKADA